MQKQTNKQTKKTMAKLNHRKKTTLLDSMIVILLLYKGLKTPPEFHAIPTWSLLCVAIMLIENLPGFL